MARLAPRAPKLNVECASENMLPRRDGRFFRSAQHLPLPLTNIALGGAGGLGLGTSCRSMGVYFADTGYQKNTATWTHKAASTH